MADTIVAYPVAFLRYPACQFLLSLVGLRMAFENENAMSEIFVSPHPLQRYLR